MSDCIRKSALIEELRKGQEVIKDKLDDISISGIYATIEAVIEEIDRQPTLDEKEIIRNAFERVLHRLEQSKDAKCFIASMPEQRLRGSDDAYDDAIEIVKEECGINE